MRLRLLVASLPALAVAAALTAGCGPSSSPSQKTAGGNASPAPQLLVLVVDDPALGENIKAEWRSRTEDEITIKQITWKQAAEAKRLPGDLIVYSAGQVGELVEAGLIAPISNRTLENDAFALRDIYKQVRLYEMKWGDKVYALPLGSPQLVLVYRSDIFAKLGLKPPQTWSEYDALAKRLAKREELGDLAPTADAPWRGAAQPLSPGYAGQFLLARSASYAAHKEQVSPLLEISTLKPLISRPPYVRALTEMTAAHVQEDEQGKLRQLTPGEAYQEVALGRCAMAITWPTAAVMLDAPEGKLKPLGFAQLPGAPDVYDFNDKKWGIRADDDDPHVPLLAVSGLMVSVTSTSGEQEAAENMAAWLASAEASARIGPASPNTTLFRIAQEPNAVQWMGPIGENGKQEYVATLHQIQDLPQRSLGIRLPGRQDYLAALDQAVVDALEGKKSPADALAQAAAHWEKVTEQRGLEAQRAALERSLGLNGDQ